MHPLAKFGKFWMGKFFDLLKIKYFSKKNKLQGRQQQWSDSIPSCGFGIEHVRGCVVFLKIEEEKNHPARLLQTLTFLEEKWERSYMDLITIFPTFHGKCCVFLLIYHIKKYFHSLDIYIQCTAPQEGKPLFGLHGIFKTKFSDGDNHFLYGFGQVFLYFGYTHLTPISIYYFQVDEKIGTISKWLGSYFPHYIQGKQVEKLRCFHLGNYCHHPTFHMTVSIFLIWIPYGDDFLFTICAMAWEIKVHRSKEWILENPVSFLPLEGNIIVAQD